MLKFQTFKKFKLPVTINPLEYGKLIFKTNKLLVVWISKTSLAVIEHENDINLVKFFVNGELIFNYRDHKIGSNKFVRRINNFEFTFENNELKSSVSTYVRMFWRLFNKNIIYNFALIQAYLKWFIFKKHIIKFFIFFEILAVLLVFGFCFWTDSETAMGVLILGKFPLKKFY